MFPASNEKIPFYFYFFTRNHPLLHMMQNISTFIFVQTTVRYLTILKTLTTHRHALSRLRFEGKRPLFRPLVLSSVTKSGGARRDEKLCEREPKLESLPLDLYGRREDIYSPSEFSFPWLEPVDDKIDAADRGQTKVEPVLNPSLCSESCRSWSAEIHA